MQKNTTFLTYDDQAEEAVALYTSLFKNSRFLSTSRHGEAGPGPRGSVVSQTFENRRPGVHRAQRRPHVHVLARTSLFVSCETQAEVEELWEKLSEGGATDRCGWLQDRLGVAWQIILRVLGELLGDPDPARAGRAMRAMLGMAKLDIAALQGAADGDA